MDNEDESAIGLVFKKEHELLQRVEKNQQQIRNNSMTLEKINSEYELLSCAYKRLLNQVEKITRINDINQVQLFKSREKLQQQKDVLRQAAITDRLTNIYNRAYLIDALSQELEKTKEFNCIFGCIIFDVDDFKKINDSYGHLVGDEALKSIANTVSMAVREEDIFGRYGGEEFLILLPHTTAAQSMVVAEKIRKNVEEVPISFQDQYISLSISLGVSDSLANNPGSGDELLSFVDKALYRAKEMGKNQSVLYAADM